MFFVSWVLWEQMTFALGTAIGIVFIAGYIKLLWTNRIVRRQEIVDEEKRLKIEGLRNSGQIIDSRRSFDIPFGVKAIQSGVQVDGIWISQANTPTGSEVRLPLSGTSSNTPLTPNTKSGISVDVRPLSKQSPKPQSKSQQDHLQNLDNSLAAHGMAGGPGTRTSYKPKKTSQLRYGSRGEVDESMNVHQPRSSNSRHAAVEEESSAADNELSSGVSSHSDTSFSQNIHSALDTQDGQFVNTYNLPSHEVLRPSAGPQSSRAEYFSHPIGTPHSEVSNPFQTPQPSPNPSGYSSTFRSNDQDFTGYHAQTQPPFVPGELHVNKAVRKVNSGFEVLPAGTFGVPSDYKGKGPEVDYNEESGDRRQPAKLQKRNQASVTTERM